MQPDCPIIYASDAFCKLTGYARDELVGRNCRFLQGPGTSAAQVLLILLHCKFPSLNVCTATAYKVHAVPNPGSALCRIV